MLVDVRESAEERRVYWLLLMLLLLLFGLLSYRPRRSAQWATEFTLFLFQMTTTTDALLIFGGLVGPSIAAAALAGAVALGIGAMALNRRRRSGYGHGQGHGKGHGQGHGGGYGHHGHSSKGYDRHSSDYDRTDYDRRGYARGVHDRSDYDRNDNGHNRKRREAVGTARERGERLMQVIRQQDTTRCGLKMVCQLAQEPEDQLADEELDVLDLVRLVPPGESLLPGSGAGDYHYALGLGQGGGNCSHAFPSCPLDGLDIMEAVRSFLP